MATFVQWLKDQEKREGDPVGWFACYWRDLEDKPRLSSPASIAKHLEDRGLFQSVNGLTEAYDATLAEFRAARAGSPLRPVPGPVPGAQDQMPAGAAEDAQAHQREYERVRDSQPPAGAATFQPPLPGAQEPAQGPAGLAVTHATAAGLAAAQARAQPQQEIITLTPASGSQLDRIEAKLDAIMDALGLAEPDELRWPDWYEQAAVYATAHGAGWDEAGA
jgi:hypothetical protein